MFVACCIFHCNKQQNPYIQFRPLFSSVQPSSSSFNTTHPPCHFAIINSESDHAFYQNIPRNFFMRSPSHLFHCSFFLFFFVSKFSIIPWLSRSFNIQPHLISSHPIQFNSIQFNPIQFSLLSKNWINSFEHDLVHILFTLVPQHTIHDIVH